MEYGFGFGSIMYLPVKTNWISTVLKILLPSIGVLEKGFPDGRRESLPFSSRKYLQRRWKLQKFRPEWNGSSRTNQKIDKWRTAKLIGSPHSHKQSNIILSEKLGLVHLLYIYIYHIIELRPFVTIYNTELRQWHLEERKAQKCQK